MLDTSSWSATEWSLVPWLSKLEDNQFITVSAPAVAATRSGFFRRNRVSAPFVQALRMDDFLYTECVGSTSFGGRYAWAPDDEAALKRLGWEPVTIGERVFAVHFPRDQTRAAARLLVVTLRDVARVADPTLLEVGSG
ncbi:hypothetical protein [Alloactinosynnema sp. L-07]|uniref:TY-Chap domain-containing protein n=1 Tax=Alloactinosynnema sp. L-07 TaxID=1653480 RepID=UPI00065F0339|nr:hypothetical protein [Alloactinosynnema sp. L-07]CRK60534.1 hypothetical protein [Alloactinosynnema sp. L-07]